MLATPSHRKSAAWLRKIRVVPPAQPLLSPAIDPAVQRTVYDALLDEKLIRLIYQRRGEQEPHGYTLRPLAVVQRGPVMYLVAALETVDDVLIFAFHRMKAAVVLPDPLQPISGFDIDKYIASGAFGWGDGQPVQLEAIFSADAAEHLRETPLAKDQRLIPLPGERIKVKATVSDTPQLQWWLLGFGDAVEVIAPKKLRSGIQKMALAMSRLYYTA